MLHLPILLALVFFGSACSRPAARVPAEDPGSAAALLAAMHDRYADTRFETLTFVQQTVMHRPDGRVDTMTWYEAMVPGKLRIDVAPIEAGNGALAGSRPDVNTLAVLLSDVFTQPPARTAAVLDSLGFDLTKLREDTWNGRPAYVVGADAGEERAAQFWVDRKHLYAVRLAEPVGPDRSHTMDVHFGGYRAVGDAWIETEILIYVDGALRQAEYYTNIRPDVPLDPALFDTTRWRVETPYWK